MHVHFCILFMDYCSLFSGTGTIEMCAHYILLTFKHYELSLKILKTLTYSGAEVIYMKS